MNNDLYLIHHGILGQKWGVRRYQNPDGTWTDAGKKRYSYEKVQGKIEAKDATDRFNKAKNIAINAKTNKEKKAASKIYSNALSDYKNAKSREKWNIKDDEKNKTII